MTANTAGEQAAPETGTTRRTRANGEQSRQRILDAATELATERGYEGTTISLVSKKSGLPPTSIYWHFTDKDDLIAAVIERSFLRWMAALDLPGGKDVRARAIELGTAGGQGAARRARLPSSGSDAGVGASPRRTARQGDVPAGAGRLASADSPTLCATSLPNSTTRVSSLITTYALDGADGLFIAKEIGGDSVDLMKLFDLHARLVFDAAVNLLAGPETTHDDSIPSAGRGGRAVI